MGSCGGSKSRDKVHVAHITPSISRQKTNILVNPAQFVRQLTGDFFEYYFLGKKLGDGNIACHFIGAYGEVYVCMQKATRLVRAVKMMNKTAIDEIETERFLTEINILKIMDHPNIVKLYEVFQDAKKYYLVTELCTGGELFEKLSKDDLMDEAESAHIMKQLLSAIVYCHSKNVVHRDLKPENLLLESMDENARVKVIDFGTSQKFNPNKKMTVKIGTPYYIAPEVLSQSYTEKCDVWSCGIILYILICGYPPFVGRNDFDIMSKIKKGIIKMSGPAWKRASDLVKDLVKHMLVYDPKLRFSAQQALNHPWIKKHCIQTFDKEYTMKLLNNMRSFRVQHKLQEAVLTFIASQLITSKEKDKLQSTFISLDLNGDGKLSTEELVAAFCQVFGASCDAEKEVESIMSQLDMDKNGHIDYTEFVLATMDKKWLITKENLKTTFSVFDRDGNGTISPFEIKQLLGVGASVSDDEWKELIKDIDENGDGEISIEEFVSMMKKMLD